MMPPGMRGKEIGGGLHDYNKQQAGDNQFQQLCFLLRSPGQEIAGGLIGEIHWGWLFINLLFCKRRTARTGLTGTAF